MRTQAAILLATVLLVTGCSFKRHVAKTHTEVSDERTASVDTKTLTEDKTLTTVTLKADTVIESPGVNMSTEGVGITTRAEVDGNVLTATYDPVQKAIRAQFTSRPKKIPVKVDKVTTVQSDVRQQVTVQADSTSSHREAMDTKDKTTKTSFVLFGIGALLLILALAYLAYRYFKGGRLF